MSIVSAELQVWCRLYSSFKININDAQLALLRASARHMKRMHN